MTLLFIRTRHVTLFAAATETGAKASTRQPSAASTADADDADEEEEGRDDPKENPDPGFKGAVLPVLVAVVSHSELRVTASWFGFLTGVSIILLRNWNGISY